MYKFYTKCASVQRRIVKFLVLPNVVHHSIDRSIFNPWIMRINLIFVSLIIPLFQVSAASHAQTITLNKKNVSIEEVFKALKQQTDFDFVYSKKQLTGTTNVSVNVKNASIRQVLDICFESQPFEYVIEDKTVIIRRRNSSLYDTRNMIDSVYVRGTVVDQEGKPLVGATVRVQGTSINAITDKYGKFILKDIDQIAVLIISYIGFNQIELKSASEMGIITLLPLASDLKEVVISNGYQQLPKERATGSFIRLDSALLERAVGPDILSRIDGITNGLYVDKRLGNNKLNVRGINTLSDGLTGALIVVDNFPYQGDISNINPNDVEDISILKDAAATSIWGAQAANGVIIIRLKKGKFNQPLKLNANLNISIVERPNLYKQKQMNSADFIEVEQMLFSQNFYEYDLSSYNESRPAISPVVNILDLKQRGLIGEDKANSLLDSYKLLDYRGDFDKYVYQPAINQQYSISVNGGADQHNYFMSGGYDRSRNNLIGNSNTRYTFHGRTEVNLLKKLQVGISFDFIQTEVINNGLSSIIAGTNKSTFYPYLKLADGSGNPLSVPRTYNQNYVDTAGRGNLLDWNYKPLEERRNSDNTNTTQDLVIGANLKYNILKGLDLELIYKYERQFSNSRIYNSNQMYFTRNLINEFTQINGNSVNRTIPNGGILDQGFDNLKNQNGRTQINYRNIFAERHEFTGLLGAEITETQTQSNSHRIYGYNDEVLSFANIDFVNQYPTFDNLYTGHMGFVPNPISLSHRLKRLVSFYSNGAYTYDRRYTISGSLRRDATNIFGVEANKKWKPLWSLGASWNVSNEQFLKLNWLDYLNVRTSYGKSGNVNANIATRPVILYIGSPASYTNLTYGTITSPPNPEAKWEQLTSFNLGVDFRFAKNILSGSFDYFRKRTNDLFSASPIDATTGFSTAYKNIGQTKGNGLELTLSSNPLKGNLKWSTTASIAYVRDKVLKYYSPAQQTTAYVANTIAISPIEGYPLYPVFSYKFSGLDATTGDPLGIFNNEVSKDYYSLIEDSLSNLTYHGSAIPLYAGNFLNTFSYKNITLSFNITFKLAYYFHRQTIRYNDLFNSWVGHSDYAKRWINPGDEKFTSVPSMTFPADFARDTFYAGSEETIERGDHIRMNDIRLSYNFQDSRTKNRVLKNLQVYLYANNVGILWQSSSSGTDPDTPENPIPLQKSISLGLKSNF